MLLIYCFKFFASAAGSNYPDHNYSLPKNNFLSFRTSSDDFRPVPNKTIPPFPPSFSRPVFIDVDAPIIIDHCQKRPLLHQRTSSSDDFRRPAQNKYVPRPLFLDANGPGRVVNPVAFQKGRLVGNAVPNQVANSQVRLASATPLTITRENGLRIPPPLAHAQKPSISIIPATSDVVQSPVNLSYKPNNSIAQTPSHSAIQKAMNKRNPNVVKWAQKLNNGFGLKLSTNTAQDLMKTVTQDTNINNSPRASLNVGQNPSKINPVPRNPNVQAILHEQINNALKTIVGNQTAIQKPPNVNNALRNQSLRVNGQQKGNSPGDLPTQNYIGLRTARHMHAKRPNRPPKPIMRPTGAQAPLVNRTPKPITKCIVAPPALVSLSSSPTRPSVSLPATTSTTHQSPLQKQMRSFMDHLHLLQKQMKGMETRGEQITTLGGEATTTTSPSNNNKVQSKDVASVTNNGLSRFVNATGTLVRPDPVPVVSTKVISTPLNAARNLSNFNKTYQKANDNKLEGVLTSQSPVSSTPTYRPVVRVIGPLLNQGANRHAPSTGAVKSQMRINGIPITRVVGAGHTSPKFVKRLIGRGIPAAPGTKRVVISRKNYSPENKTQTSPIRIVPAQSTNNHLQRKMVANLNKLTSPSTPTQYKFKNGVNVKVPAHRKNDQPTRSNLLPSLSPHKPPVSKSNKENRKKRRLSLRGLGNPKVAASIDLSNEDGSDATGSSLSQEMVNTLRKKGVSINYVGKETNGGVIKLD